MENDPLSEESAPGDDKDYHSGKIPLQLKHQLEKLTESASILIALILIVLRGQVNELLNQLESRLRVPELEVVEGLGSDDRATWLK